MTSARVNKECYTTAAASRLDMNPFTAKAYLLADLKMEIKVSRASEKHNQDFVDLLSQYEENERRR